MKKVIAINNEGLIAISDQNIIYYFKTKNGFTLTNKYYIDTVSIHGVEHEFLVKDNYGHQVETFVHSPECQCMKKDK